MTGSPLRRAGAVLASAFVLAACGSAAAQPTSLPPLAPSTPTPTAAMSPTATAVATPKATSTPGKFDEATQAEAEAFVEEWWAAVNAALAGKTAVEELRNYYASSCVSCLEIYADIKNVRADGQSARGGGQEVLTTTFSQNAGSAAAVLSSVKPVPGKLLNSDGRVIKTVQGGDPVDYIVVLQRKESAWIVKELRLLGRRL